MPYTAIQREEPGGGIVRLQKVNFFPNSIGYGNTGGVPPGGTIALLGPGSTNLGIRVPADMKLMGASFLVNLIDASRTFNASIRVNGAEVAAIPLPLSTLGAQVTSLNIPVVTGDVVTVVIVRTSGTGASTFIQMRVQVLVG
jgi:hypothetical protein